MDAETPELKKLFFLASKKRPEEALFVVKKKSFLSEEL